MSATMKRIKLGSSELEVSPLCVGTWQFNSGQTTADRTWNAQSEEESRAIVDKALELGINFFDTAEAYLNSEETLGRILEGRRKNVVIATKFGARLNEYKATDIETSLTTSLQRLKTDYIDLYQVHWASYISNNLSECVAELNRQKAKGTIREWAVSNFGPQNLTEVINAGGKPVSNQLPYNLLWRAIEHDIVPTCQKHGLNILAYSPLQQGLLTGKFRKLEDVPEGRRRTKLFSSTSTSLSRHEQAGCEKQLFQAIDDIAAVCTEADVSMPVAALSWLLQQPAMCSTIVGASSPKQVEDNVKVVTLQQDVLDRLSGVTDELKGAVGNNPDPWAKVSRIQ